jgi:hypothetical protein
MRQATLQFLRRERDELRLDIGLLEAGRREVIDLDGGGKRQNITLRALGDLLARLGRFEELIAAYEARLG